MGPHKAELVFIGLMAFCFLASIYFCYAMQKDWDAGILVFACCMFMFIPASYSVHIGQNSALSLFCLCGFIFFARKQNPFGDACAGLFLALWTFKPHFPLLAVLFMLLTFRWRVLFYAGFGVIALWLVGGAVAGGETLFLWFDCVANPSSTPFEKRTHLYVSVYGAIAALVKSFGYPAHTLLAKALGGAIGFSLAVYSFWVAVPVFRKALGNIDRATAALLILGPLTVLANPHIFYYDVGLCLPALVYFIRPKNDKDFTFLFVGYVGVLYATMNRAFLAFSPLVFAPLFALVFGLCKLKGQERLSSSTE
jgi:hypothetical protein